MCGPFPERLALGDKKFFQEVNMHSKSKYLGGSLLMGMVIVFASLVIINLGKAAEHKSTSQAKAKTAKQATGFSFVVTPVQGPSWIKFLGLFDIRYTAMGQRGGILPAPLSSRIEPKFQIESPPPRGRMGMGMGGMMGRIYSNFQTSPSEVARLMDEKFFLTGGDLYRLNCQSCHGPKGEGSPPEINSLIGPVKGSSPDLVEEKMKKMGRPIGAEMAKELASQAEASIRKRLLEGGKKMPPFKHLDKEEGDALLKYLQVHFGELKSKGKDILVTQSVARVGQHLVQGTCHICHDATGPGRGRMGMMQSNIPSLASFPWEQSIQSLVRQVEYGTTGMMMRMGGQKMPAYPYVTEDESAAAYLYLVRYPPFL